MTYWVSTGFLLNLAEPHLQWQPSQVSGGVRVQDDSLDPHGCPPLQHIHIQGYTLQMCTYMPPSLNSTLAPIAMHPCQDPEVTVEGTDNQVPCSYFYTHSWLQPLVLVLASTTICVSATGLCHYSGTCSYSPLLSVCTPPGLLHHCCLSWSLATGPGSATHPWTCCPAPLDLGLQHTPVCSYFQVKVSP